MKKICRMSAIALFMSLVVSGLALAQSDLGTISGYVKDQSGATVANAKITVQNDRGVTRQATTNEAGYYAVTNIPPGRYTVTVEAPGFQKYESRDNKLDPSASLAIDPALVVGSASQTVRSE